MRGQITFSEEAAGLTGLDWKEKKGLSYSPVVAPRHLRLHRAWSCLRLESSGSYGGIQFANNKQS